MRGKRAIAAVSCVLAVSVSALAGCGGRGVANDDQTLEVYCWQAGYGTDWVTPLLEDFGTLDSQELSAAEDFSAGLDTEDMDIETFEE